jgi:hypothetical protein
VATAVVRTPAGGSGLCGGADYGRTGAERDACRWHDRGRVRESARLKIILSRPRRAYVTAACAHCHESCKKFLGHRGYEAVFESKFMLPWSFSEEAAAEKYMPQLQHNMWVTHLRTSVLSIITGGGKWVEIAIPMDPLYLSVLVSAEKKFWRCVQSGEVPHLVLAEPPRPRIEVVRIVDMRLHS